MLDDYGSMISAGAASVPNPMEAELNMAKVGLAHAAVQGQQLQNAAAIQSLKLQGLELQRRVQFGQDMQSFVQNPSAEGLAGLVGKYPEFASDAESAWGTLDTAERRSTATQLGSVAALAARGDYGDAAQLVQARIDADSKAGKDTTAAQQMLQMLKSGDPAQQRSVIGTASVLAGGAVGFDKAADFLKGIGLSQAPEKLAPGEALVNPQTGERIASQSPNLSPVTVTNADGSQTATAFNPQTGAFGGAAVNGTPQAGTSQTGTPSATGMNGAIAQVLHNEGGFNPQDMNGAPTNFGINQKANAAILKQMGVGSVKDLTQDQAAQIYAMKYWPQSGAANLPANMQTPYFDVYVRNPAFAKTALARSGGDPAKFMQLASAYFQKLAQTPKGQQYAQAWANRDAVNTQLATGAAPAGAPIAAPVNQSPYTFGGSQPGAVNVKGAPDGFAWNASHTAVVPLTGSEQDPNSYNSQEIDDLARNWIVTGQWGGGGGGMGGGNIPNGLKKAAMARASTIMQSIGVSSDQLPQLRSQYAADKSSLSNINGVLSGLQGSENALRANAQQVFKTQQKLVNDNIIDNGSPILNGIRIGTYKHLGSAETKADIKAYEDAMNAYAVEYAKFMSSANGIGGSAAPSDSSQERAADLNDTGMGPATLNAHINQTLIEARNRKNGLAAQAQNLNNRLSSYLQPHGSNAPAGVTQIHSVQQYNSLGHGAHYIDPNGVYRIKP